MLRLSLFMLFALALLPPAARAQVVVRDQADTFIDERTQYTARTATNPEKWWGGDTRDNPNQPLGAASVTMVPGNPVNTQPLFSFEDMLNADAETAEPPSYTPPANPGDAAAEREAREYMSAHTQDGQTPPEAAPLPDGDAAGTDAPANPFADEAPPPVVEPTGEAAPALTDAPALADVPAETVPPAETPLSPPPVEDEAAAAPPSPAPDSGAGELLAAPGDPAPPAAPQ